MSCITVIDVWLGQIWTLMQYSQINIHIFTYLMERYAAFLLHLEFSLKYKIGLQGVRLNSCKSDVLYYCNRLLIESCLNFDKALTY